MPEDREVALKRLRMRSWRRGTKEMDLILGGFADSGLAALDDAALARYSALLEENDHDLYRWFSGQENPPAAYAALIAHIAGSAGFGG